MAQAKQKYTVIKAGRHGEVGEVLTAHPRAMTFKLTQQLVAKGELKGKALEEAIKKANPAADKTPAKTETK
jgi:hypothetical protein